MTWIITDPTEARKILSDPRYVKDTALAPPGLENLEPTAADQLSLTTLDGPAHLELDALAEAVRKHFPRNRFRCAAPPSAP